MKILVTGAAGFIGVSVIKRLIEDGNKVVGIDNINDYYDPALKYDRLKMIGIGAESKEWGKAVISKKWTNLVFIRLDIVDKENIIKLFEQEEFQIVIHLAAQPGVRYSISHPQEYIENNINGFLNILEGCRLYKIKHLIFASSSSVYGLNGKVPFSEKDSTEHPVSLYAATKKSNEMMAHAYSHIYSLPVTGLRFFTVYGPWGRPDMSPFLFIDGILNKKPIKVFNQGDMLRDFTYIDDIVECVSRIINIIPKENKNWNSFNPDPSSSIAPYRIYNIGNQNPTKLLDYISAIEEEIGIPAIKEMLPMQRGDIYQTYADSSTLTQVINYKPGTNLKLGIKETVNWFRDYYKI